VNAKALGECLDVTVVLMCNEQITVRAVAACFVEREQLHRTDMYHQWQLSLPHRLITLWAARKPRILVWIEEETVLWGLFAKPGHGFLFPGCHGDLLSFYCARSSYMLMSPGSQALW